MDNNGEVKNTLYQEPMNKNKGKKVRKNDGKEAMDEAFNNVRGQETYIPFHPVVLREMLIADYLPKTSDHSSKFRELCRRISLRNNARLQIENGDAYEKYTPLNPDALATFNEALEADEMEQKRHEEEMTRTVSVKLGLGTKISPQNESKPTNPTTESPSASLDAKSKTESQRFQDRLTTFNSELDDLILKSSFFPLSEDQLALIETLTGRHGLEVSSPSSEVLETRFWFRGVYRREYTRRRWIFFKKIESELMMTRLMMAFRLLIPANKDDLAVDSSREEALKKAGKTSTSHQGCLYKFANIPHKNDLDLLRDDFIYMRLYKDIPAADIDMLLPGSVAKFHFLDHAMVWLPLLIGLGSAIHELVKSTFDFHSLQNGMVSMFLIVTPLLVSMRAYNNLKHRAQEYQDEINNLFLMGSLGTNAGVISQMINEAQEQEDNEALIAYFLLWRGQACPAPMRLRELDKEAERWMTNRRRMLRTFGCEGDATSNGEPNSSSKTQQNAKTPKTPPPLKNSHSETHSGPSVLKQVDEADVSFNFEVADAVRKLRLLGLLRSPTAGLNLSDPDQTVQVLPIDEAIQAAHLKMFSEEEEYAAVMAKMVGEGTETTRAGKLALLDQPLVWRECVEVYKPTGQPFRYFFNTATGQSQYEPPAEPYIPLPNSVSSSSTPSSSSTLSPPVVPLPSTAPPSLAKSGESKTPASYNTNAAAAAAAVAVRSPANVIQNSPANGIQNSPANGIKSAVGPFEIEQHKNPSQPSLNPTSNAASVITASSGLSPAPQGKEPLAPAIAAAAPINSAAKAQTQPPSPQPPSPQPPSPQPPSPQPPSPQPPSPQPPFQSLPPAAPQAMAPAVLKPQVPPLLPLPQQAPQMQQPMKPQGPLAPIRAPGASMQTTIVY